MNIKRYWKPSYKIPAMIVGIPLFFALFVFVGGGIVMLLWNWLLPPIFGLPRITLLQGFGFLVLGRLLFGGFGGGGGGRSDHSKRMSPEERERLGQRMCQEHRATQTSGDKPGPGATSGRE
jgi:hypothetical protein